MSTFWWNVSGVVAMANGGCGGGGIVVVLLACCIHVALWDLSTFAACCGAPAAAQLGYRPALSLTIARHLPVECCKGVQVRGTRIGASHRHACSSPHRADAPMAVLQQCACLLI